LKKERGLSQLDRDNVSENGSMAGWGQRYPRDKGLKTSFSVRDEASNSITSPLGEALKHRKFPPSPLYFC